MTLNGFLALALQSVTDPRGVAKLLLSMRLGTEAIATAFALVIVLNGLVYALIELVSPDGSGVMGGPMVVMALQAATLVLTVVAVTWAGRGLGGAGGMQQIAVLMIWLQALRALAQAGILVLLIAIPFLGTLAVFAVSVLGVWIAVHFVDEAHGFGNLLKALMVLIVGVLAMAIALSIVLTMVGVTPPGVADYV